MVEGKTNPLLTDQEIKNYLSSRRVVVISEQIGTAKAVRKLFVQLGSKPNDAILATDFKEAQKELKKPTHLLVTDLLIEKDSGLELANLQEEPFLSRAEVTTIVMCSDPTNSSTGMMMEANLDGILIKPFNLDSFKTVLVQALMNKAKPSPLWISLEQAKAHFKKSEIDKAELEFENCRKLAPVPTLPLYYLSLIRSEQNRPMEALEYLKEALLLEPNHYRSLIAQIAVYMRLGDYAASYQSAAQFSKYYPVNAERIPDFIKLSIYNKKFEDIVDYAKIFKQLENKSGPLSRVIIAGTLVCAKYFISQEKREQALELFNVAIKNSIETNLLQSEVFRYLIESKFYEDAEKFYLQFSEPLKEQVIIQVLYIELLHLTDQTTATVQACSKLIQAGMRTPRLFSLLIENSKKIGRSESVIENLIADAKSYFPEHPF